MPGGTRSSIDSPGGPRSGQQLAFWHVRRLDCIPELLREQLDVNVAVVVQLIPAALPPMLDAATGMVVNVASITGLLRGRVSTYLVSKAYVIAFTEGLANAVKGTGVGLHVLCPGFVRTEFHQRAGADTSLTPAARWLEAAEVVAECLRDVCSGNTVIVPGGGTKRSRPRIACCRAFLSAR